MLNRLTRVNLLLFYVLITGYMSFYFSMPVYAFEDINPEQILSSTKDAEGNRYLLIQQNEQPVSIVAVDVNGDLLWRQQQTADDQLQLLMTDGQTLYAAGSQISIGQPEVIVMAYDLAGGYLWSSVLSSGYSPTAMVANKTTIFLSGKTSGRSEDLFVVALDMSGQLVWQSEFVTDARLVAKVLTVTKTALVLAADSQVEKRFSVLFYDLEGELRHSVNFGLADKVVLQTIEADQPVVTAQAQGSGETVMNEDGTVTSSGGGSASASACNEDDTVCGEASATGEGSVTTGEGSATASGSGTASVTYQNGETSITITASGEGTASVSNTGEASAQGSGSVIWVLEENGEVVDSGETEGGGEASFSTDSRL